MEVYDKDGNYVGKLIQLTTSYLKGKKGYAYVLVRSTPLT